MPARKLQVDKSNSLILPRGDYSKTLDAILKAGFCPFCEEHLMKHHRKPLLFKTKHWLVTENSWPYEGSRRHMLFISREHTDAVEKLSASAWIDLQNMYQKVVRKFRLKGASLVLRSGDTAYTGASVSHLHAHLVSGGPRKKKSEPIKALVAFKK